MNAVAEDNTSFIDLPEVRGKYRLNADLSGTNWFRVGGAADVLFRPADAEDLAQFLRHKPADMPVTLLGVGSNIIVRDGGIDGVVIKLGRGFTQLQVDGDVLEAGAANLSLNAALFAAEQGRAGLEFLSGIPGTIGGALAMNAGAYGDETADCLIEAEVVTGRGEIKRVSVDELGYSYRHCSAPADWVFTRGFFRTREGAPEAIKARIAEIQAQREASQPIRTRTGGSTFKNPDGKKAWEVIDAAGCRGMMVGEAKMSEKHCNFMENTGNASAADLEALGEQVKQKVKAHCGVDLQWEIKRIGKP